jgi:transposase
VSARRPPRYRDELPEGQWEPIAPFCPDRYPPGGAGPPGKEPRPRGKGMLWPLPPGAPWPDPPERYGPWQLVSDRFTRWRKDGTWAKSLDALLLRRDTPGLSARARWRVAASVRRASRAAAGAKKKGGLPADVSRAGGPAPASTARPGAGALAGRR